MDSRDSSSAGGSTRILAAASSIASGRPSNRRQISATIGASPARRVKPADRRAPGTGRWRAAPQDRRPARPAPVSPAARPETRVPPAPGGLPGWSPARPRAGRIEEPEHVRPGPQYLFEIVQHQQELPVSAMRQPSLCRYGVESRSSMPSWSATASSTRFGSPKCGQVDEHHSIREVARQLGGYLQRQPGLADAARTGQGHKPGSLSDDHVQSRPSPIRPARSAGSVDWVATDCLSWLPNFPTGGWRQQ